MSDMVETRRKQRHPIRGFVAGLFFGVGAVILLAVSGGGAFSAWWPFAVIAGGCAVLGLFVGLFARAR